MTRLLISSIFFNLGSVENCLLVSMAYDHYVAVCNPLCYATTMCTWIVTGCYPLASWIPEPILGSLSVSPFVRWRWSITFSLIRLLSWYSLALIDIQMIWFLFLFCSHSILIFSPHSHLVSYPIICIIFLKMHGATGYLKAIFTCPSHFPVVILCRSVIFMYLQPRSSHAMDEKKAVSVFYTMAIQMLNPLIWSQRNDEIITIQKECFQDKMHLLYYFYIFDLWYT